MKPSIAFALFTAFALIVASFDSANAQVSLVPAGRIVWVYEAIGSGQIGNTTFANANFAITAVGSNPRTIDNDFGTSYRQGFDYAEILIERVGQFEFDLDVQHRLVAYANPRSQSVGIFNIPPIGAYDLLRGPSDPALADWDMNSSIGPIAGTGRLLQWDRTVMNTSGGRLVFNDEDNIPVTFSATVYSVPEPSSIMLLVIASAVMWIRRGC